MHRCHRTISVFLLLLWGTLTVHCGLEVDGLLLGPGRHETSSVDGNDHDTDPDGCATIENGYFAADAHSLALVPPLWLAAFVLPATPLAASPPRLAVVEKRILGPPELVPSWSFVRRAAPPARAPVFAS